MRLRRVLHALGFAAEDVNALLAADDPAARLGERFQRVQLCLRRRYAALVRCREVIELLRRRIEQEEKASAGLARRMEQRLALGVTGEDADYSRELLAARRSLDRKHAALCRREAAYRGHLAAVAELRRRQARIHARRVRLY